MTSTQQPAAANPIPAPDADQADDPTVHLTPDADSRLAQLQAAYPAAKAAADAAAAALKTITDGLKAELSAARPDDTTERLQVDAAGDAPALRLTYVRSWGIDTKRLKAEDPHTYARWAVQSGSWRLAPVKG